MSVLKNKRGISQYEYEHTFNTMYGYFRTQLNKVPVRRRTWISTQITDILRDVHHSIMELSTGYAPHTRRAKYKHDLIINALDGLSSMQKPLYCHWDIMKTDLKHRQTWCEHINKEIILLHGMLKANSLYTDEDDLHVKYLMYYKREDIDNAKFLSNMRELHRYTHGKVIHANRQFDGFESATLIELVDDAWYHCIEANKKIPKTKAEYAIRRTHLSKSISCLRKLNRPMLSLFILMGYSERIMREWSGLLVDELKLITALQSSDKKRFGTLK